METRRVQAILTTTQPITAYGGIQLHKQVLKDLAEAVKSGAIPMVFNHDLRRRVTVSDVDAGVRQREDGYWEAWAEFTVPASEWDEFQQELAELGAPGGMSFKGSVPFLRTSDEAPVISIAADAHHFTDDDLLHAARTLAGKAPAEVERLYSFAFEPPALVVVQILLEWAAQVPPEVFGSYLYDALKRFLRPRSGKGTILNFEITRTTGTTTVRAHLENASDSVLREALERLHAIAGGEGIHEFEENEWKQLGE